MKALNLLILVSILVASSAECPFSNRGANAPPPYNIAPPNDNTAPPPPDSAAPPVPPATTESPAAAPTPSPVLAPVLASAPVPEPSQNTTGGKLSVDYYANVCPNLESLVPGSVSGMMASSPIAAAATLRLFFHDCFITSGGPTWQVELGRYDALVSKASDVDLPLDERMWVQTLGATSCFFVNNRIYPTNDAYSDPGFASQLQGICPSNMDSNSFVFFDQSMTTFDNNYSLMWQQKKGVLFSDNALYFDSSTLAIVDKFAVDQNAFFKAFAESMVTLGRLGLKTTADGEIRKNWFVPN